MRASVRDATNGAALRGLRPPSSFEIVDGGQAGPSREGDLEGRKSVMRSFRETDKF